MRKMIIFGCIAGWATLVSTDLHRLKQDDKGKNLFRNNCGACHAPAKVLLGPPFQGIRKDYGLTWTVDFVKDAKAMIQKGDSKALYIYYNFDETWHQAFPSLTKKDIVSILDYVDNYRPTGATLDTTLYQHRKLTEEDREQFIQLYRQKKSSTPISE